MRTARSSVQTNGPVEAGNDHLDPYDQSRQMPISTLSLFWLQTELNSHERQERLFCVHTAFIPSDTDVCFFSQILLVGVSDASTFKNIYFF